MKEPFWREVKCTWYLQPVRDGRCVHLLQDENQKIIGAEYWGGGDDIPDTCDCCGALEFVKTYYKRKHKEFSGVSVGERTVVTTAFLFADTACDCIGRGWIYSGKQTKDVEQCAIVYFRPGQKRLVPLDMIRRD